MSFKLEIETKFTKEEMDEINKEVQLRVDAFIKKEKENCRGELMEMVDAKVDTILMFDTKNLLMNDGSLIDDTPPRPSPPDKPDLLEPKDDTPLRPLIDNKEEVFK